MPLPMVHLAIAVKIGALISIEPSPAFLLGSIAPDSIHMRPNTQRSDKNITHLFISDDWSDPTLEARVLDFAGQYADTPDSQRVFTSGYAAHILTDWLWVQKIIPVFRAAIPADADDTAQRELYYSETDQIDFNIYHRSAWQSQVWTQLAEAEAIDLPPLLSAEEIDAWRSRTLRWFTELKNEPGITPQYITDALVAQFVADTADALITYQAEGKWEIRL